MNGSYYNSTSGFGYFTNATNSSSFGAYSCVYPFLYSLAFKIKESYASILAVLSIFYVSIDWYNIYI